MLALQAPQLPTVAAGTVPLSGQAGSVGELEFLKQNGAEVPADERAGEAPA